MPELIKVRSSGVKPIGSTVAVSFIGSPVRRGSADGARRRCATLVVRKAVLQSNRQTDRTPGDSLENLFTPAASRDLGSRVDYRTEGRLRELRDEGIDFALLRLPIAD
jgi:hypothetical protein